MKWPSAITTRVNSLVEVAALPITVSPLPFPVRLLAEDLLKEQGHNLKIKVA